VQNSVRCLFYIGKFPAGLLRESNQYIKQRFYTICCTT